MVATPPERVVLVVDDDDAVRRITARILSSAGFRTLEAQDGAEALDLLGRLGSQVVWLVVCDIVMPGIPGDELADIIGQKWPGVQVLLLSAQPAHRESFTGSFLQKPFKAETLISVATSLLPPHKVSIG